jgi:uncharacterized protein YfkK (UPF0435 family)
MTKLTVLIKFFILFLFQINFFSAQENRKDSLNDALIYVEKNVQIFSSDDIFSKQLQNVAIANDRKIKTCPSLQKSESLNKTEQIEIKTVFKNKKLAFKNEGVTKHEEKETLEKIHEFQKRKKNISRPEMFATHSEGSFKAYRGLDKTSIFQTVHHYFLGKFFAIKDFAAKENLKFIHSQEYVFYNSRSLDFCFSTVFSVRPPPCFS